MSQSQTQHHGSILPAHEMISPIPVPKSKFKRFNQSAESENNHVQVHLLFRHDGGVERYACFSLYRPTSRFSCICAELCYEGRRTASASGQRTENLLRPAANCSSAAAPNCSRTCAHGLHQVRKREQGLFSPDRQQLRSQHTEEQAEAEAICTVAYLRVFGVQDIPHQLNTFAHSAMMDGNPQVASAKSLCRPRDPILDLGLKSFMV